MVQEDIGSQLQEKLKLIFGYNQFRGNQEAVIKNLLDGKNTFVIKPTGAGKSMCYQLPAITSGGTAIVISPLIALMKNQVDQLRAIGINAHFLNSTLSKAESTKVKDELLRGKTKLLYVAPESLIKEANIELFQKAEISFVAIDEAHCISEWGHDFRPEYRKIKQIVEQFGNLPIIALTATATPKVQADIQKNLRMEEADVFLSSFNRENLYYEVKPKIDSKKQLVRYIQERRGKSGIIYCLSRKKVEEIAAFLQVNDIRALPYHAGMEASTRMKNQDAFLNEDTDVIVATIAFGMGIDKPDVRFVIHYDVPKSLEGYYQETGRAGRDGLDGSCLMLFSPKDLIKLEKFSKDKPVTERENAKLLLNEMEFYANSSVCRRKQLLNYFGEYFHEDCGFCDNCKKERKEYQAQEYVLIALETIKQTEERFTINHLINVIIGNEEDEYVNSYQHDQLEMFGKGKDKDAAFWKSAIRQAMIEQLLVKDTEDITVIKITDKGFEYLKNPTPLTFSEDHDYSNAEVYVEENENFGGEKAFDDTLYHMMKDLRKKVAKKHKFPPYAIFQDPSLEEMATIYPTTESELAQINGVGMGKVQKFGKPFIKLIKEYIEENDITPASDVVVKSAVNKSKTKIFIIQQIDRMVDLEDISEAKNMSFEDLIEEIENICYSGTKLNLDYYIEQMMDHHTQDEIYQYFMEAETDSISEAFAELGEDTYSDEELRLMRIKFLSEIAL